MAAGIILVFGVILVFSNVMGIGVLSAHIAQHTRRPWLTALIAFVTLGVLYCLWFLCTPLDGNLKDEFLARLPYEVGMLLGLGLLWIQWMIQVILYWQRRRHSPMMYRIFNILTLGQVVNLIGIGLIFFLSPTMVIIQGGLSRDPTTYKSEWLFELGWLTYFTLSFATPLLLLSLKGIPKFWQMRHWVASLSSLAMVSWWVYWFNYADIVRSVALN